MAFIRSLIFMISSFLLSVLPYSEYTEGVTGQPNSFLPHQTVTETEKTISGLIYRGLFKYDIYGALVPDLAESWDITEEGTVYTVTLKKDQRWSDGSEITSDDLLYTTFKMPSLGGVGTDKVDDHTVRYILPNKFSPFQSLLTKGVMKNNSEENYDPLSPVVSGDFRVIDVNKSGPVVRQITLVNKRSNPEFKKLSFRFYSNEEELLTAAKLGEINAFISNEEQDLSGFVEHKFPLQGVYYALFMNLRDEKLDKSFREKLRETIYVKEIAQGRGIFVQGAISKSDYTDPKIKTDYFNEDFVEENFLEEITITLPDLPVHKAVAKQIKKMWKERLNLDVKLNYVSADNFTEEIINPRNFEVLLYGQEVGRDPDRYVYWHSTQADEPGLNITGLAHVRADRALEEGRNETDLATRLVHYREFQKVIEEQVPAIFLYHPFAKYYVSNKITGFAEKYTFSLSDRFLDFDIWTR